MKTISHNKLNYILLLIIMTFSFSCEETEEPSYLDQWVGNYEGSAYSWSLQWNSSADSSIKRESTWTVFAKVRKGEVDSSLSVSLFDALTNDDSPIKSFSNLKFSDSGYHHSYYGGGSGSSSITIFFEADSMHYLSDGQGGMANRYGTEFGIARKR